MRPSGRGITMNSLPNSKRRRLFLRLWWRSVTVKRPQAILAFLSLAVGAAVMSMLLNLYGGVRRSMTQQFRSYGANAVLAPRLSAPTGEGSQELGLPEYAAASGTLDQSVMGALEAFVGQRRGVTALPVLYGVVRLIPLRPDPRLRDGANVVAVGTDLAALRRMNPAWRASRARDDSAALPGCLVGARVASRLLVAPGDTIRLEALDSSLAEGGGAGATCRLSSVLTTGASEDEQVFLPLQELQTIMGMTGKISLVQLRLEGETSEIESSLRQLASALPGVDVRPIRQIVYSEGRVLGVIRWFLVSVTSLILIIIVMCLMATMTAMALERRKDIGVMKALGATDLQVMGLFMAEGASLGMLGGALGCLVGGGWAFGLARRLFGVALKVIWWTSPLVCSLAALLAVGAALCLVRTVRAIEPAVVLRGE